MSEEAKGKALASVVSTISALKEKNPLVLYGIVGLLIIMILSLFIGGGTTTSARITVVAGETYTMRNPNKGPVLLVAAPGLLSSAEEESKDGANICSVAPGTQVKVDETQGAFGIENLYARVIPLSGDCKDKSGWTTVANLRQ